VAYTATTVDSNIQAAFNADLPLFLTNDLPTANYYRWVQGTLWTDTNRSNDLTPPEAAFDGLPWVTSTPTDPLTTATWTLIIGFETPIDVDLFAVQLKEPMQISGSCTYSVSVADDSGGSPGSFATFHSEAWESTTMRKCNYMDLSGSHRLIQSVDWIRFSWTNLTSPPDVGQIWAGARKQLPCHPQRPYNPLMRTAESEIGRGLGRRTFSVKKHYYRFRDYKLRFLAQDYPDANYRINTRTNLRSVWAGSEYGRRPVLYVSSPSTDLNGFCAGQIVNQPSFALQGPLHSVVDIDLIELAMQEGTE